MANTVETQPSTIQHGRHQGLYCPQPISSTLITKVKQAGSPSYTESLPCNAPFTLPADVQPSSGGPTRRTLLQTWQIGPKFHKSPRLFCLPASYGCSIRIRLVGSTEPFDYAAYPHVRQNVNSTHGYTFFDPSIGCHKTFDEPVASFMQDQGNLVVMCRIHNNDPLWLYVAVQYELLNQNAQVWVSRWLHPENPDGGGQLYKISGRVQYWRVQHIMATMGSKVKIRYFGGHVAVIPRNHLHETMRPLADSLARRYQSGDYRPV